MQLTLPNLIRCSSYMLSFVWKSIFYLWCIFGRTFLFFGVYHCIPLSRDASQIYEFVPMFFCGGARATPMILWFPISCVSPTTVNNCNIFTFQQWSHDFWQKPLFFCCFLWVCWAWNSNNDSTSKQVMCLLFSSIYDHTCYRNQKILHSLKGLIFLSQQSIQMLHVWIIYLHWVKHGHIQGEM